MRKIKLLEHISLDGYMAGPNGEIDWILMDDEIGDYVHTAIISTADTAIYGRITYQMMESFWPTAAEMPNAPRHVIAHAGWVNKAKKIVFSRSLDKVEWYNTRLVKEDIPGEVTKLKQQPGKDIVLLGSGSIAHLLMQHNLIDEYYLTINPVILGEGFPLFTTLPGKINLRLTGTKTFANGAVSMQYAKE